MKMAGCTRISIMCMAACPMKNADVCKPAGKVQDSLNLLSCMHIYTYKLAFVLGRLHMSRCPG